MRIPTETECERLMAEMEMLEHIVDHSRQVCRVALLLVERLGGGVALNPELVRAAALLHDITKTRSFTTRENHAATGAEFLGERGFPEVGRIVGQHVTLAAYPDSAPPAEAEIVNYADKRVLHDRVVSLDERMAYILDRYGRLPEQCERIRRLWRRSTLLERRIFARLDFSPDMVALFLGQ
jgi:putative nucleotidyltransferase with HDIG domain